MAKLIHSPYECAHRVANSACFYILDKPMSCIAKEEDNFPKTCPLEDGVNHVRTHILTNNVERDMTDPNKQKHPIPFACLYCGHKDLDYCINVCPDLMVDESNKIPDTECGIYEKEIDYNTIHHCFVEPVPNNQIKTKKSY